MSTESSLRPLKHLADKGLVEPSILMVNEEYLLKLDLKVTNTLRELTDLVYLPLTDRYFKPRLQRLFLATDDLRLNQRDLLVDLLAKVSAACESAVEAAMSHNRQWAAECDFIIESDEDMKLAPEHLDYTQRRMQMVIFDPIARLNQTELSRQNAEVEKTLHRHFLNNRLTTDLSKPVDPTNEDTQVQAKAEPVSKPVRQPTVLATKGISRNKGWEPNTDHIPLNKVQLQHKIDRQAKLNEQLLAERERKFELFKQAKGKIEARQRRKGVSEQRAIGEREEDSEAIWLLFETEEDRLRREAEERRKIEEEEERRRELELERKRQQEAAMKKIEEERMRREEVIQKTRFRMKARERCGITLVEPIMDVNGTKMRLSLDKSGKIKIEGTDFVYQISGKDPLTKKRRSYFREISCVGNKIAVMSSNGKNDSPTHVTVLQYEMVAKQHTITEVTSKMYEYPGDRCNLLAFERERVMFIVFSRWNAIELIRLDNQELWEVHSYDHREAFYIKSIHWAIPGRKILVAFFGGMFSVCNDYTLEIEGPH